MRGLYQWFSDRASFFRSDFVGRGTSRTVRTEVTVQREAMTLMVSEAPAASAAARSVDRRSLRHRFGQQDFVLRRLRLRGNRFRAMVFPHEFWTPET